MNPHAFFAHCYVCFSQGLAIGVIGFFFFNLVASAILGFFEAPIDDDPIPPVAPDMHNIGRLD